LRSKTRAVDVPTAETHSIIMHFAFTRRYSVIDLRTWLYDWNTIRISNPVLRVIRSIDFDNWKIPRLIVLFFLPFREYNEVRYIYIYKYDWYYYRPRAIVTRNNNIRPSGSQAAACDFLFTHKHTHTHIHLYDTCGSLMFNSVIISLEQPIVEKVKVHDILCDVIIYIIKPWKRLYIANPQTMVWFLWDYPVWSCFYAPPHAHCRWTSAHHRLCYIFGVGLT